MAAFGSSRHQGLARLMTPFDALRSFHFGTLGLILGARLLPLSPQGGPKEISKLSNSVGRSVPVCVIPSWDV